MGVTGGNITFARFAIEHRGEPPKDLKRWLARGLEKDRFEPLARSSDEERAAGWVELEDQDATKLAPASFSFGDHAVFTYRVDKLVVPKAAVKAEVDAWSKAYAEKSGRGPARSELREQKELVIKKLRQRAFLATRSYDVSWNLASGELSIWAGSRKTVEEIQICLEEALGVSLVPASPGNLAMRLGHDVSKLPPTAELCGLEISAGEADSRVA